MGLFGEKQKSLYDRGCELYFRQEYEKAIRCLTKGADVGKYGETHYTAACFDMLGDAKRHIGDDGALQDYAEAARIYRKVGESYPAVLAELKLADIYLYWKNDRANAFRCLKAGLAYEPSARAMLVKIYLAEGRPLQEAAPFICKDMIGKRAPSDDVLSALEDVTAEELYRVGVRCLETGDRVLAYALLSYVQYWDEEEPCKKAEQALTELEADEELMAWIGELRAKYDEFQPDFKTE